MIANEQLLIKNGFKKVYPDEVDKEYYYLLKNIKPHHFRGLHIIVDKTISVYCKEPNKKINGLQNGSGTNNDILILFYENRISYIEKTFKHLNIELKK